MEQVAYSARWSGFDSAGHKQTFVPGRGYTLHRGLLS